MPILSPRLSPAHPVAVRGRAPDVLAGMLGFTLVVYLALANGGFDTVVRSEIGVVLWWLVLSGAVAGVLPRRLPVRAWWAVGLLGALVAWTAASAAWSESAERSWGEAGATATYLAFLLVAVAAQRRSAARSTLHGVAAAIALVGVLALLSRLQPSWFPVNDQAEVLGDASRLSYPLNYWNALAALMAIGVPLLLAVGAGARRLSVQAAAVGLVPVLTLVAWLTQSRGGLVATAVAVLAWMLLAEDRLVRLCSLATAGFGSVLLVIAVDRRPILGEGLATAAAERAGDRFLGLVVPVVLGVALVQAAIGLASRQAWRPRRLRPTPRRFAGILAGGVLVLAVAGVAAGAPERMGELWDDFTARQGSAVTGTTPIERLRSATSNGRYQYWEAAVDAAAEHPLAGTGAGTFEFWWTRNATTAGYVHDAHSLYLETLAELGVVGLMLVASLLVLILATGVVRALRAPPELRTVLAAATAAALAWTVTAAYEWIWELAVMTVVLLAMGAVILAGRDEPGGASERAEGRGPLHGEGRGRKLGARPGRLAVVILSVAALPLVALPLAGAKRLASSRAARAEGRPADALRAARSAERVQPYAATPLLQQALVLERTGDVARALVRVRRATRAEPTNWRPWLVRARIEAEAGSTRAALESFRRFAALNPRSELLRP